MRAVCIIFEVREPLGLKWYWPRKGYASVDPEALYFDRERQREAFERHVRLSYLPANDLLMGLAREGAKFSFVPDGSFLELCSGHDELLSSFRSLAGKGMEFLGTPYNSTLSCFFESLDEFRHEVELQKQALRDLFGVVPATFANAGLIFNGRIGDLLRRSGFSKAIIQGDSLDTRFGYRTDSGLVALPVHPRLSADIEERFSDPSWVCYPLIAAKYASWISEIDGELTVLYMSYRSFGVGHARSSRIFEFLASLPAELDKRGIRMITPSEYAGRETEYSEFYDTVSRTPIDSLLGNHMQHLYYHEIKRMEGQVKRCPHQYADLWRKLQTTDILADMAATRPWYPWDRAVSDILLLSDFKRRVIEEMR